MPATSPSDKARPHVIHVEHPHRLIKSTGAPKALLAAEIRGIRHDRVKPRRQSQARNRSARRPHSQAKPAAGDQRHRSRAGAQPMASAYVRLARRTRPACDDCRARTGPRTRPRAPGCRCRQQIRPASKAHRKSPSPSCAARRRPVRRRVPIGMLERDDRALVAVRVVLLRRPGGERRYPADPVQHAFGAGGPRRHRARRDRQGCRWSLRARRCRHRHRRAACRSRGRTAASRSRTSGIRPACRASRRSGRGEAARG